MENERLARVEERCERIPVIENKLDRLIEKSEARWGRILGASMVVSFVATMIVEILRK